MQEPVRKLKADENTILNGMPDVYITEYPVLLIHNPRTTTETQERNDRALAVLNRVQHKLTGS